MQKDRALLFTIEYHELRADPWHQESMDLTLIDLSRSRHPA
jgi:hypothetical protein